jgi:hypothetical protein
MTMPEIGGLPLVPGARIVVRTPDQRAYYGWLLEVREAPPGNDQAVVRLDTGWVTSYPVRMIHAVPDDPATGQA